MGGILDPVKKVEGVLEEKVVIMEKSVLRRMIHL